MQSANDLRFIVLSCAWIIYALSTTSCSSKKTGAMANNEAAAVSATAPPAGWSEKMQALSKTSPT